MKKCPGKRLEEDQVPYGVDFILQSTQQLFKRRWKRWMCFRKIPLVAVWGEIMRPHWYFQRAAAGISFPLYIVLFCRSPLFNLDWKGETATHLVNLGPSFVGFLEVYLSDCVEGKRKPLTVANRYQWSDTRCSVFEDKRLVNS